MKSIRRNLYYFILWLIFFVIITIYVWTDSSVNRMTETILSNNRNRRSIVSVQPSLTTGRRNQACIVINDSILVNIGGHQIHTIEFQDLRSGVIRNVYNKHLDIHHHVALLHNGEIWLPCGLSGNGVKSETSLKHMLIVNIETGGVRQGPRLRYPRGLCGAVIISQMVINKENIQGITNDQSQQINLNPSKWVEDVICILGGSIGQHDAGNLTSHVECYSERANGWIILPDLPVQLDHLVAHTYNRPRDGHITARMVSTKWHEDQVLVVIGGRTEDGGDETREIYTMSLRAGYWTLAAKMIESRTAFASCMFDNRYIIVAGGVSYRYEEPSVPLVFSEIEVCDILTGKCNVSNARLQTGRFETTGCSTNELCYICGGTIHSKDDLDSCESFIKHDLLNIVNG